MERIDLLQSFKPKIGLYVGSFDPFHLGHYSVLTEAEKVFDKVIIGRGINLDKNKDIPKSELPNVVSNRQYVEYTGLLTDYLKTLHYEVTIIKGIRNANDLLYEQTQLEFLKDLKPDINVAYFFGDAKYHHISSSSIKMLQSYGVNINHLLPWK